MKTKLADDMVIVEEAEIAALIFLNIAGIERPTGTTSVDLLLRMHLEYPSYCPAVCNAGKAVVDYLREQMADVKILH